MKRFFFTVIALAAVTVSCTKSGLLESPETYLDEIAFEPYTGKAPVTKAVAADNATLLSGFRVIGFTAAKDENNKEIIADPTTPYLRKMVFGTTETKPVEDENGDPVMEGDVPKTETVTKWSYTGAMFWPTDNLLFVAYGLNVNGDEPEAYDDTDDSDKDYYGDVIPGNDDIFTINDNDYTSFTYKVPASRSAQKDLIISPVTKGEKGKTVAMKLYHVLSRIGFSIDVNNETSNPPVVKITAIKLKGNFITEATFDFDNAVAVNNRGEVSYTAPGTQPQAYTTYSFYVEGESEFETNSTDKLPIYPKNGDVNDRYMMLVPGTMGTDASITVSYEIGDVPQDDAVLSLANHPFEAGKAYEFVFTLSTAAVGFNVVVNPWDEDHEDASTDSSLK